MNNPQHDFNAEAQELRNTPPVWQRVTNSKPALWAWAIVSHRYVIGVCAGCLAFGIWHNFYPSAANKGANLAWSAVEGTANFVGRAARKINP